MLLRAPLVLKNTAQKVLIHKTFWWCGTFAPNLAPEHSINFFGAGQHYLFPGRGGAGRGSVEIFRGGGGPGQPFLPGAGRASMLWGLKWT